MTASDRPPPGLPGGPRRLHPASPVLDLVLSARQWAFPLVILVVSSGSSVLLGPAALIVLGLVVGWKVLAWSRFSYQLTGDVLVIEQGVLQRVRREVPVARIQQVDLRRKLRHRALGVAVVRVDTAGGASGAEVVLEAVDDAAAGALRAALLRHRASEATAPSTSGGPGAAAGDHHQPGEPGDLASDPFGGAVVHPPVPAPRQLVALSPAQLVVAGLTGSRLLAALPLAAAAIGLLFELPGDAADGVLAALPTGTVAIVAGLAAAVPLLLAAAVASSLLTDFGFTLVRSGDDLHLRRGLLDQREATLSLHRVQVVRVHQNLVRRRLGLHAVQLQSAGSGHQAEGEVTRLTIPYVTDAGLSDLLEQVLPVAVAHPPLVPAPPAARRRAWLRRVGPALALAAVLGLWVHAAIGSPVALIALVLVVPAALEAELVFRNLGHVATSVLVVTRAGGFVRATSYVPVAKSQSTTLTSSPFQRRAGLASLQIHVAGRGEVPLVHDGDAARLADLRRGALDATAARRDEAEVRRRARADAPPAAVPLGAPAATGHGSV